MTQTKVNLVKTVYGANTYEKVVDVSFRELISPQTASLASSMTVEEFFQQYERLFFEIPVSGSINSHSYLVERGTQYIGGNVEDEETRALIEEINALRQQLLDLGQTYLTISTIS